MDTCKWHEDGFEIKGRGYWETGCKNLHQFTKLHADNHSGPKQNHFEFCPYCGKPIEEVEG